MRYLSYGVMVYMLLALIWWTTLLSKNNKLLFKAKTELLKSSFDINNNSEAVVFKTKQYEKIEDEFLRSKYMILGEGFVFGVSLILGIWMIQKAYNQEMENTKSQKNFLLSVTHELKSPIASINLITETLLKRKLSAEKTTELHESILSESTRLEKLINNLLLAARIEHQYQYNFESINIVTLIKEIVEKQRFQNPTAFISYLHDTEPIIISADKEGIISLVNNLIENAIKYSTETVEIEVILNKIDDNLNIEIKDQGIGINESEKPKLTQQFYRIGNEETRQTKGTGLGLYIVDKMTKAHKGKMKIKNNTPKGTNFTITLPLKT